MSKPSSERPERAAPSSSSERESSTCSGEKKTGSHPSAISPTSCVFFGPDRGDVHRDALLDRRDHQLERLAGPVGQRQRVGLAVVGQPLARERLAHDLDVLLRARELLAEALPVPALGHLGPGGAQPEQEAPVREVVERDGGHRRHGRRAAGDLQDRRAELDPLGLGGEPRERSGGVGAVGLRGPDGLEPRALGLEQQRALALGRQAEPPVAEHQAEAHASLLSRVVRVPKGGASYGEHR